MVSDRREKETEQIKRNREGGNNFYLFQWNQYHLCCRTTTTHHRHNRRRITIAGP
jgi:hypothetical protein